MSCESLGTTLLLLQALLMCFGLPNANFPDYFDGVLPLLKSPSFRIPTSISSFYGLLIIVNVEVTNDGKVSGKSKLSSSLKERYLQFTCYKIGFS